MVKEKTSTTVGVKKTRKSVKVGKPIAHAIGRRKNAIARVWVRRGSGRVRVNGIASDVYFDTSITRTASVCPLALVPISNGYDFDVVVAGGGKVGQAGAVKLSIARAFVALDGTIKPVMKKEGLLTVDSRNKERKKYGRRGARRSFQFVKR